MRFRLAALAAALAAVFAAAPPALAQSPSSTTVAAAPDNSGLDAELFYQLLLGELNVRGNEPTAGFALILDAARKTNDASLYQRAVELAFEARSGDAALQAARAWKQAFPQSREANRYVLQILVALNRLPESLEPLKTEIALSDAKDRPAVIAAVARAYSRATDKKQAAAILEQGLADYLNKPDTGASAWSAVGRLRLAAGDTNGALDAARRGQAAGPNAEGPVLLALELMDPKLPQAEAIVRTYMQGQPLPELRLSYARALLDAQRQREALQQLQQVTRERPDFPEAWLAQGTLLAQDNQLPEAEAALKRYLELAQAQPPSEDRGRGTAQAYLSLAQIAEKRKDFAQANAWLDRIENSQDLIQAQNRRASILARQGKMAEARKLIQALPERNPADARMKAMAEVQLLRDNKDYKGAYDLLAQTIAKDPGDPDLLYDQAMVAEKMGRFDDMERLLRQLMEKKPDYHHAYNALGYSLAERGVRLPEAKQLVQKALEFAPGDPFISDSLAWVEFRMGNKAEALRILQDAYKERPDPEIAAHLGEVLWSLGQRDQAQSIWREGLLLNAENETLQETLKRLKVKP
ncbi:tetratricopeptide repeat protein [Ramlibacter sp. USB13]|uniref:Tetratricopeptide repeat protein n=1 Tax=Ramlibacter cellulosilyticus TaxID=2764187 RepID=A0A923SEE5_9BURK|nr:tetratricopeptide repeat protein [Ramlibacter cellulosilyticus]